MKIKILLIDDDSMSNFVSKKFLQREFPDFEIISFLGGKTAIDFLRLHSSQEDVGYLIFLDINMPMISGWKFLEMLEETLPGVDARVVMLTSSVDYNDREKASSFRLVMGFLSKPLCRSDLAVLKEFILGDLEAFLSVQGNY